MNGTSKVKYLFIACALIFLLVFSTSGSLFRVEAPVATAQTCPTLRMTMLIPPNSLNWISLTTGGAGYDLIYLEYLVLSVDGLRNPDGSAAALHSISDWQTSNANYTEWSFNIKPGLKWSDGTNVTSKDILATFSSAFYYNETVSDSFHWGPEVKNLVMDNSSEVTFYLNQSEPLWDQQMGGEVGYGPVYPAEVINSQGNEFLDLGTVVADGPFYTSNYSAGATTMTLLRNPYFQPQPTICQIDVNFVESLALTTTYLKSGTTDVAPVEWSNVGSVLTNPNYALFDQKGIDMTTLEFNDSIYPYNMTQFRQALVYGINESQIVSDAFSGYGITGYSGEGDLSPSVTEWYNPSQAQYSYNPTMATTLLSQIGITKGSDGHLQYPNGTDVTLTIWSDTDTTADLTTQSDVQANLQSLGFIVDTPSSSEANIIGYYDTNQQNILKDILLYTASATVMEPGQVLFAVLPGWDYYYGPVVPSNYWVWPPTQNTEWYNNQSAFFAATTTAGEQAAFNNMQSIAAQYLPTVVLAYPDDVFAYNSHSFTGWPTHGVFDLGGGPLNHTALVSLAPSTGTTSSTTSPTSSTQSTTSSSPTTTSSPTTSTSTSTTVSSSSTTTSGSSLLLVAVAAVVIVVVIAGVAAFVLRSRRPKT
jgi:ABC-type transport system substrate-binding protein